MGRTACVVWLFSVWGWYRAAPEPSGPPSAEQAAGQHPAPVPSLCSPRWAQALPCSPRGPCLEPGSLSDRPRPRPRQLLSRAGSVCLTLSSVPCPASCLVSVATSLPCTSVPARRPCGAGHRAGGDGGFLHPSLGGHPVPGRQLTSGAAWAVPLWTWEDQGPVVPVCCPRSLCPHGTGWGGEELSLLLQGGKGVTCPEWGAEPLQEIPSRAQRSSSVDPFLRDGCDCWTGPSAHRPAE